MSPRSHPLSHYSILPPYFRSLHLFFKEHSKIKEEQHSKCNAIAPPTLSSKKIKIMSKDFQLDFYCSHQQQLKIQARQVDSPKLEYESQLELNTKAKP